MPKLFNDVTTDVQSPPQYVKANIGDLPEDTKKLILQSYPDLKPLTFPSRDQATVYKAMLVRTLAHLKWLYTQELPGDPFSWLCRQLQQICQDGN